MTGDIVRLLLGLIALFAGRNVFWLFIAVIGFLFGADLATYWLQNQAAWVGIVAGIGAGLLGALLAILYERVAFALAGFYAAAFLANLASLRLGYAMVPYPAVIAIGIVGAIIAAVLTDWAIIVFSALAGATAIASVVPATPAVQATCLLLLALAGIIVQRKVLMRQRR
jgi:hypothetical protein